MNSEHNGISDDNILILKSRFKVVSANIYGQILIIFNNQKEFESYNLVVSSYSDVYKIDLNTEWDKYEEKIVDLKWKGQFNNNFTSSLLDLLTGFSGEQQNVSMLYDNIYNYNYKELEITIYDLINRIIHEKNLTLETVIQEIPPLEYINVKERRSKPKESDDDQKTVDNSSNAVTGSVILPIDLMLSPVKGKPIYNLKIGDRLMVKIKPGSEKAKYLIDDLGLREDKNVKPVPAEVIDIKAGEQRNDPIEILTKIIPGYYGKSFENEKQVKLKIFDPAKDDEISVNSIKPLNGIKTDRPVIVDSEPILSKGTLVMLLLFFLIVALFFLLIFISW